MRRAAGFSVAFAILAGCVGDDPDLGCGELLARQSSGSAPLIEALQDDRWDLLEGLAAMAGDPLAGEPVGSAWGDGASRLEAPTLSGGEAWIHTQGYDVLGFGLRRPGHDASFDAAGAQALLAPLVARLGLDGVAIEVENATDIGHHRDEGVDSWWDASAPLRLAGTVVAVGVDDEDYARGVSVRLASSQGYSWDGTAQPLENTTSYFVGAMVRLPTASSLLPREDAVSLAGRAVACLVRDRRADLGGVGSEYVEEELRVVADAVAYRVQVEYGPTCPEGAWNPSGREWETLVFVDAVTGAILRVTEAEWNCIDVAAPQEAALRDIGRP